MIKNDVIKKYKLEVQSTENELKILRELRHKISRNVIKNIPQEGYTLEQNYFLYNLVVYYYKNMNNKDYHGKIIQNRKRFFR